MTVTFLNPSSSFDVAETSLSIAPDLIAAMNKWRLAQLPVQSPNEAIISLIQLGLEVSGEDQPVVSAKRSEDAMVDDLAQQFRAHLTTR